MVHRRLVTALSFVCLIAIACCVIAAAPAAAAVETLHLDSIAIPSTTTAPPIDGTLDSPVWKSAAVAHLGYDLRYHATAAQSTTLYLITDGPFLYVGIDARQSTPIRATEHTNGVGLDTDDEVQVDLWPNGTSGFRYKFTSTPIGTHYQFSTENNSFEPEWWTAGRVVDGGYVITEKIPLSVMHGTGSGSWRVQFIRYLAVTNDVFVWSWGASQQNFNDVTYSGSLSGLPRLSVQRGRSRVGVYGLGEVAPKSNGGDTSRVGADISIPIVTGTSFVATLHPDYSNVEIDQQTIAPTAFQRIFADVRPFFTQGANVYSYPQGICGGCPGIIEFYTPNIPTPRDGYAVEGQHGLFSYGALHTEITGRTDTGDAIDYVSPNQRTAIDFQGSQVDAGAGVIEKAPVHDLADGMTFTENNLTDFQVFARYSNDAGTNVLDAHQSQRYEVGSGWFNAQGASVNTVIRKVGTYFDPVDGIVQHPDIAGYDVNFFAPFKFATTDRFTEFDLNGDLARYHDHTGELDQTNGNVNASLTTRTLFNLQVSTGSSYVLLPPVFTPVTQQGVQLGYNLNGLLPSFVAFNRGRFGPGELDSWFRSATVRTGTRGALTLEADDTQQFVDSGDLVTQWLDRLDYSYQSGPDQSFAFGVRRIIGVSPLLFASTTQQIQALPAADAWNLSAAYHRKVPGGELYVVYGDAATFQTSPRFIIKYIKYFGADKGT
jgi:hypothetical protein